MISNPSPQAIRRNHHGETQRRVSQDNPTRYKAERATGIDDRSDQTCPQVALFATELHDHRTGCDVNEPGRKTAGKLTHAQNFHAQRLGPERQGWLTPERNAMIKHRGDPVIEGHHLASDLRITRLRRIHQRVKRQSRQPGKTDGNQDQP
ncbi:hypothetical protein D3C84_637740 [compost metagenome]